MAERCVAARCTNVADPKNNISMHKILFFGEEPIKKKRRKRWINFVLEKSKMWVRGRRFISKYRYNNTDHILVM